MVERSVTQGGWLHRYAVAVAAATFVLIIAGGLVTSTDSGLAVPDWPLSYGMLFPPMVGGIFYEHGHRMIAGVVGIMTVLLAAWLGRCESRRWVRVLGAAAVATVVIQALLGGITVLYLLPPIVSTSHLGTAMAFFAIVSTLALVTGPTWSRVQVRQSQRRGNLPRLALATTLAIYLQVLLGAAMRHTGAGLACPDFPLCNGRVVPELAASGVALHMTHRVGALVVTALVVLLVARIRAVYPELPELRRPAMIAMALVGAQIVLGALSVLSGLAVAVTTAHVGGGALLLSSLVVLTLRLHRRLAPGAGSGTVATTAGAPA